MFQAKVWQVFVVFFLWGAFLASCVACATFTLLTIIFTALAL